MLRSKITLILIWLVSSVHAQQADSVIFSYDQFLSMLKVYHPVLRQAELLTDQAAQELRLARGAFDPKVEAQWYKKSFKDKEYYNTFKAALKVPTWLPINPEVGFEQNSGEYLNPEKFISETTNNQQVYAGVNLTLGRGMFIDQRRAVVREAKVFQEMATFEQRKVVNKFLLNATSDYWEWYFTYFNYDLAVQGQAIADDIFDRTRLAFEYGEVAAIDTVQAFISRQKRIAELQQAKLDLDNAALRLAVHLWNDDGAPLELSEIARPQTVVIDGSSQEVLAGLIQRARANHPELRKLELKNDALLIDQSLARENIKPQLDLGYYLIDQPFNADGENNSIDINEDYKLGLNFSFPIFLRKERAKLKQTQLKIADNNYERDFQERQILNEINVWFNAVTNTASLVVVQQQMVTGYEAIVRAERLNLMNGESDLFKMNAQLDKLIESRYKLIKLKSTYMKNMAYLYWAAGLNMSEE